MMMGSGTYCSVEKCKNKGKTKRTRPDLTFHRFPKDVALRDKWIKKCGRKQSFSIESAVICSDHFAPEDYRRNLQAELLGESKIKKFLLPEAVPNKNLPSDVEKNEDIKVVQKKPELSEEEKIAERKALVEEAIKWAESLPVKRPHRTNESANETLNIPQKLLRINYEARKRNIFVDNATKNRTAETLKNRLDENVTHCAMIETALRPSIIEPTTQDSISDTQKIKVIPKIISTQDVAVPEVNSKITLRTHQLQLEKIADINGCSVQILKPISNATVSKTVKCASVQTMQLPVLRPVGSMELGSVKPILQTTATPVVLPSSVNSPRVIPENETFAEKLPRNPVEANDDAMLKKKYYELELRYMDLDMKYKRCYKTLCCFKTAYNKLKSQNYTARSKITDLRQKNKALERQLRDKRKSKKHKLVQTTATEMTDDVSSWW